MYDVPFHEDALICLGFYLPADTDPVKKAWKPQWTSPEKTDSFFR